MRMTIAALAILLTALLTGPVPTASASAADGRGEDRFGARTSERVTTLATLRKRVVKLTNNRRENRGCRALRQVRSLNRAAQKHTRLMANRDVLTHQFAGEPSPPTRMRNAGYNWNLWGENIASGYPDARSVVRGWMNSPPHRRNILNCRFKHIGVGYAKSDGGTAYWTQDFGRR